MGVNAAFMNSTLELQAVFTGKQTCISNASEIAETGKQLLELVVAIVLWGMREASEINGSFSHWTT